MVKSIKGLDVDFSAMIAREESVIAVTGGGERMNAKGDIINSKGRVIKKREDIVAEYANSETNVKNVSLADRKFNNANHIIPGTEKKPVPTNTAKEAVYVVGKPVETSGAFEEVGGKKPAQAKQKTIAANSLPSDSVSTKMTDFNETEADNNQNLSNSTKNEKPTRRLIHRFPEGKPNQEDGI